MKLIRHRQRAAYASGLLRVTPWAVLRHSQHVDIRVLKWPHAPRIQMSDYFTYESRGRSVMRLLDQAITNEDLAEIPWSRFAVSTGDQPVDLPLRKTFVFCDDGSGKFNERLFPDFLYDSWPEVGISDYEHVRMRLLHQAHGTARMHRVGWIGTPLNDVRVLASRIADDNPDLLDYRCITWCRQPDGTVTAPNAMSLDEQQAEWYALLDLEGHGWSARLKLLLAMGRPVIIQERPWKEWWFSSLIPHVHYAPVRRDLTDLPEVAQRVLEDRAYAESLAANATTFAREQLPRQRALEHIRELLLGPPPPR